MRKKESAFHFSNLLTLYCIGPFHRPLATPFFIPALKQKGLVFANVGGDISLK